jgi:hypothetical protein
VFGIAVVPRPPRREIRAPSPSPRRRCRDTELIDDDRRRCLISATRRRDEGALPVSERHSGASCPLEIGHQGEAIGWEGWAGHDPDTGLTAVIFTITCSDIVEVLKGTGAVDPAFESYAEMLVSMLDS